MKKIAVLLAEGFEEIEALTPVDYLRRAGAEVTVAGVTGMSVRGSHGIVVQADAPFDQSFVSAGWDAVVVPGGMGGSKNIAASALAGEFLRSCAEGGAFVCAICAAPVIVLAKLGILKGRSYTCYPEMENELAAYAGSDWQALTAGAKHTEERAVCDGKLITARGAGAAEEFALLIAAKVLGEAAAEKLRASIVAR